MMISFSKGALDLLFESHKEAKRRNHKFVTPEHLLSVFLQKNSICLFFIKCDIDYSFMRKAVEEYLETKVPKTVADEAGKDEEELFGFKRFDPDSVDIFEETDETEQIMLFAERILKKEAFARASVTDASGKDAQSGAFDASIASAEKAEGAETGSFTASVAHAEAAGSADGADGSANPSDASEVSPDTVFVDFSPDEFLPQSFGFSSVLNRAIEQRICAEKETVRIVDLILALFDEEDSYCSYFMKKGGGKRVKILETISRPLDDKEPRVKDSPSDEVKDMADLLEFMEDVELFSELTQGEESTAVYFPSDECMRNFGDEFDDDECCPYGDTESDKRGILERFTVDLTERARKGELDPLIGRREELERTIQILCRRIKNNPIHVGESGVGKTALTEGLAALIVKGQVPDILRDFSVLSLDVTSLIAGTQYRGDLEKRITRIFDALLKRGNVILFIDEIHTIMGAGSVEGDPIGVGGMLKSLFLSPTIRCIGATTHAEYVRYFEKDAAMARRFQKVVVEEPSVSDAVLILKGLRARYEAFHAVTYEDAALETAVKLAHRFITDRYLPDTAIDVIDEAGAYVRLHPAEFATTMGVASGKATNEKPIITSALIEKVTAKIARVPEQTVSGTETERLKTLEQTLSATIFGQDKAVHAVTQAVKRGRAGFRNGEKPIASFLFVGPTGVGKTELARALASELGVTLHRFDMSEYQEKHTVSRLIGSPPGYVGFEEGALLINAVRKEPNAVLLLDEIEKAHSDIFNVLLQVMDYATLTDSHGRKADFRHVILIMTSNAGARDVNKNIIGFGGRTRDESAMNDAVEKTFTPEFRNRLDAVVPFSHLSRETIENVTKKEVEKLAMRLNEKGVELVVKPAAITLLATLGYSNDFGARNIARTVDEKIAAVLVDEVLFGRLSNGGKATCGAKDNSIVISYAKPKKR